MDKGQSNRAKDCRYHTSSFLSNAKLTEKVSVVLWAPINDMLDMCTWATIFELLQYMYISVSLFIQIWSKFIPRVTVKETICSSLPKIISYRTSSLKAYFIVKGISFMFKPTLCLVQVLRYIMMTDYQTWDLIFQVLLHLFLILLIVFF